MITEQQLISMGASPQNAKKYAEPLSQACEEYGIDTKARICQFLAQVFHESASLQRTSENLNYSAEALLRLFPSKIKTIEEAKAIERNPKAIGEKIYNNLYGRGLIQLTGLANYQACSRDLGVTFVDKPYLLEQPEYAALSAAWFFRMQINGNAIADMDNEEAVRLLTKKINGYAMLGLQDRINYWKKAKQVFSFYEENKYLNANLPINNVIDKNIKKV